MSNFNLGSLTSWQPVALGELLAFDVLPDQIRHVEFEYISDSVVRVTAVQGDDVWPLAIAEGHNSIKFTVAETVGVVFDGDPSAIVCIKTRTETQVIGEDGEISYTTVEPRQRQVPDQMRRYMLMMNLNQRNREAAMRAEFEKRLADQNELIERDRAPTLKERQQAAAAAQTALPGDTPPADQTPAPTAS